MTTTTDTLTPGQALDLVTLAARESTHLSGWLVSDLRAAVANGTGHYLNHTLIGDFLMFRGAHGWVRIYVHLTDPETDPWGYGVPRTP